MALKSDQQFTALLLHLRIMIVLLGFIAGLMVAFAWEYLWPCRPGKPLSGPAVQLSHVGESFELPTQCPQPSSPTRARGPILDPVRAANAGGSAPLNVPPRGPDVGHRSRMPACR